jgi:hypothetical protein
MHTHVTYGEMESHDVWSPKLSRDNPPLTIAGHFANPRWLGSVPTTAEAPPARRRLAAVVARAAARRAGPKYLALRQSMTLQRAQASSRGKPERVFHSGAGWRRCVRRPIARAIRSTSCTRSAAARAKELHARGDCCTAESSFAPARQPEELHARAIAARRQYRCHRASLPWQRHSTPWRASPKSCTHGRGDHCAAAAPPPPRLAREAAWPPGALVGAGPMLLRTPRSRQCRAPS